MKQISKLIFVLILSFLFIGIVNADDAIGDLKLECPGTIGYDTTFDCELYGTVSKNSNITGLEVTDITNSKMFKTTNIINYDISRMTGNLKLATYTGKTLSTSGKASVAVRVAYNDIYFKYVTFRIKITDKNTNLSSITVDNTKIDNFKENDTSYKVTTGKDNVDIGATTVSKKSKVSGTGTKKLSCGDNEIKLEVTSESGDKKTYSLNVKKDCDLESTVVLKGLKYSAGELRPKFDAKTTDYKLVVPTETSKITLTGEVEKGLTVTGNLKDKEINPGFNKFTITVKAKDGTKKDYLVNVIRQKDDAYLSSLSLSSGAFNFDRNTFNYETTVVYDTTNVDVRAIAEAENSKIEITGGKDLKVGENLISVKVTSESEDENTYNIKLIRLNQDETLGDNPYIKDIRIKGYDINFDPNIVNYSLKIGSEKKLDIEVVMADSESIYQILGNKNLKDGSVITIKSTSSGGFVKLYKIKISKTNSMIYTFVFGIIGILITGLLIALFIINRKDKALKVPLISSDLLSGEIDFNKRDDTYIPEDTKVNIEGNPLEGNNMINCPKCGFKMPNNISTCPNCRLKLK